MVEFVAKTTNRTYKKGGKTMCGLQINVPMNLMMAYELKNGYYKIYMELIKEVK